MSNPTRTEAIKAFLTHRTHEDLAALYHYGMECQVIVAQDNGERIQGEFQGARWSGYTDDSGIVWKPFRIPRNANDEPVYTDVPMTYDIAIHAEGVGMTGWDWVARASRWVAFDFDAILGHSDRHSSKLDADELKRVREAAMNIDWVTVRYSTGGRGLHLYVFLDSVPTRNHTEHAGLARAILNKMSALAGFDFNAKVDICGGNMWVWHRKMIDNPTGLKLIKQGDILINVPENWRDHINVISGKRRRIKHNLPLQELEDKFDQLSGQKTRIRLDSEHRKLIEWLERTGRHYWWDGDNHMLVTHTIHLKAAHTELDLRGIFETDTRESSEQNCFAFPMRRGSWAVRRYSAGCKEHPSWEQDGKGWTRCYLNREPDLKIASMSFRGVEDPSGGFCFAHASDAVEAALALGSNIEIPPSIDGRTATLKPHKDGKRIVVEVPEEPHDDASKLKGWLRKGKKWIRIFNAQQPQQSEIDMEDYDDVVRHIITPDGGDAGWVLNAGAWNDEPLTHVKSGLKILGLKPPEIELIIGSNVFRPWLLVNKPFQQEYPGERQWNRRSPQFNYVPNMSDELHHPSWTSILQHVGKALDNAIIDHQWCKSYGIRTGSDYLKCWIASLLQFPEEPLPYLFFYSDAQNTGKSMLHEAVSLLFSPGYQRADQALTNPNSFNAELEGAVLCVVEEVNLSTNKVAYDRIKDWVTSRILPIHRKMMTPYHVTNTSHWIQCANNRKNVPIFPGDTRITMIHVPDPPEKQIPKSRLIDMLIKEAPDFLGALLSLEIPPTEDRLRIPAIETSDKIDAANINRSQVEVFVNDHCYYAPGEAIKLSTFFDKFREWLDPSERLIWTKQKVSSSMPSKFVKGRIDNEWHWGNISFTEPVEEKKLLICVGERLFTTEEVERVRSM